jgi:hypothetical protein
MRWLLYGRLLTAIALAAGAPGCGGGGGIQGAAAKDPMKCERDPSCARQRARYPDCTRQCADDQECERRCEQVQRSVDTMGHP